jgi:TonB family protein
VNAIRDIRPGSPLAPLDVHEKAATSRLIRFGMLALALEFVVLTAVGTAQHWLAHPQQNKSLDASHFVEAEMVEIPKEKPALMEEKPSAAPAVHEKVISKVPDKGREAKPEEKKSLDESNQTSKSHTQLGPNHGPVAVFSPSPTIPPYLQNQDLHSSVVIDFYINAQGGVVPKLVNSSGNQELDAVAITTAKKWQFRPAEKNHLPIDSKVRLRILFEVH